MTDRIRPVAGLRLGPESGEAAARLVDEATRVRGSAQRAVDLARRISSAPRPGEGRTIELWGLLARIASADLTAARVVEAHLDAVSILAQAGVPGRADAGWGVYAAEAAGLRLEATEDADGWQLTGTKPWCSVAGLLDSALITAHTPAGRRLFSIDLADRGVAVEQGAWFARGLSDLTSGPIHLAAVRAAPVGDTGWYLTRPGFSWGAIGVAACWFGGAVAVAHALLRQTQHRDPDQLALAHIAALDAMIHANRVLLEAAAEEVDAGRAQGDDGRILAARVRAGVARLVEETIHRVGHALGPAPLSLDEEHARRVADLQLYVRQHHAERDDASLGTAVLRAEMQW